MPYLNRVSILSKPSYPIPKLFTNYSKYVILNISMEQEQPTYTDTITPTPPSNKKKRLIAVGSMLAIFFVTSLIFLFFSLTPETKPTQKAQQVQTVKITQAPIGSQHPSPTPIVTTTAPTITTNLNSPEVIAKNFYIWYVTHPSPLASGDYEKRTDISPQYKSIMGRYVKRGIPTDRDPIFNCGTTFLPVNITAGKAEYNTDKNQALVTIYEGSTNKKLFQIKVQKYEQTWLIRDIWCGN